MRDLKIGFAQRDQKLTAFEIVTLLVRLDPVVHSIKRKLRHEMSGCRALSSRRGQVSKMILFI